LKMNGYIRDWGLDTHKHASFLGDTVQQMISYSSAAILNKSSTQFAKAHGGRSDIQKAAVTWLGLHAFHTVLSLKPARYSSLLTKLKASLDHPRNHRYKRRFRVLTREGLAQLT
ncbi:hypothetical protein C8R44DRAFT_591212, partial [Mycena epipterygia]